MWMLVIYTSNWLWELWTYFGLQQYPMTETDLSKVSVKHSESPYKQGLSDMNLDM